MMFYGSARDTMARVLATDVAQQAITRMSGIINSSLQQELNSLMSSGDQLADPNNWDGQLAQSFRGDTWPQTKSALNQTLQQLNELHDQLSKITQNIMQAGGNA